MIDSGGQPQFHEVLSIFVQHLSLLIVVIKLSEPLSARTDVKFFNDKGELANKIYKSTYTHEQNIRQSIRCLKSEAGKPGAVPPALAFIGTHRDEECAEEPLEVKDKIVHQIICEMLPPELQECVISRSNTLEHAIIPINAKSPQPIDYRRITSLRESVMKKCSPQKRKLPLKWHGLEMALQKMMEELGRKVLHKDECFGVAIRMHFSDEEFEAALQYFNELNIVSYYKDNLPQVVFGTSQVVVDKITEIVQYYLWLEKNPEESPSRGDKRKFLEKGVVSVELLSSNELNKHYEGGLFGPEETFVLLNSLLVTAEINPGEYIMPCLLHLNEVEPQAANCPIPSLYLLFPDGGPEIGTYCAIVSHVISHSGWELLATRKGKPVELSRNSASFHLPFDLSGKVMIIDPLSAHLEIRIITPAKNVPKVLELVCPLVRENILEAIKAAIVVLGFSNGMPKFAFLCPEQSALCSVDDHLAIVSADHTSLKCTVNPVDVAGDVTEKQKCWLSPALSFCSSELYSAIL